MQRCSPMKGRRLRVGADDARCEVESGRVLTRERIARLNRLQATQSIPYAMVQRPGLRGHRSRAPALRAFATSITQGSSSLGGDRHTIEVAPSAGADEASSGVVATGAVGSRYVG
jgi:hypothetical protein